MKLVVDVGVARSVYQTFESASTDVQDYKAVFVQLMKYACGLSDTAEVANNKVWAALKSANFVRTQENSLGVLTEDDVNAIGQKLVTLLPSDLARKCDLPNDYAKASDIPTDYAKSREIPTDYLKASDLPNDYAKSSELPTYATAEALKAVKDVTDKIYTAVGSSVAQSSDLELVKTGIESVKSTINSSVAHKTDIPTDYVKASVGTGISKSLGELDTKVNALQTSVVNAVNTKLSGVVETLVNLTIAANKAYQDAMDAVAQAANREGEIQDQTQSFTTAVRSLQEFKTALEGVALIAAASNNRIEDLNAVLNRADQTIAEYTTQLNTLSTANEQSVDALDKTISSVNSLNGSVQGAYGAMVESLSKYSTAISELKSSIIKASETDNAWRSKEFAQRDAHAKRDDQTAKLDIYSGRVIGLIDALTRIEMSDTQQGRLSLEKNRFSLERTEAAKPKVF